MQDEILEIIWEITTKFIHLRQLLSTVDFNNDCIVVEEQSYGQWYNKCCNLISTDNKVGNLEDPQVDIDVGT